MITKTFKRYEKKYQLDTYQFNKLLPELLLHMNPNGYLSSKDSYPIYNIYFDTENFDVIRHSLSKPYYKEKLRLRSYTIPETAEDLVFIELKKKIGGIVSKRRVPLTLKEANEFIAFGQYPEKLKDQSHLVLDEIRYYLETHTVEPKTYISYERMAFVGKSDPEFRLTFDFNIKTRKDYLSLDAGDFGSLLLPKNYYIMEIKILGSIPLWLSHTLSELKIYSSSFSKYGTAYKKYRKESFGAVFNFPVQQNSVCQNPTYQQPIYQNSAMKY
ncbi:polyphosphate polymerase domain-containing protein [Acetobacterium bakii]|uniref:polyphosphate polymerase domain-containing protein n=1 Tax=Acetobacterium bakii TaxID=52689 RepID=UPI0009F9D331|nr:polyphosphate polymerase domain-containing protein [Acetobacterium bakii]